jgi:hypothetical protein
MAKLISFRLIGAAALCSAAFVLAGVAPRLHAAPVGSEMTDPLRATEVNRLGKGDRLPLFHPHAVRLELPAGSRAQRKVPLGCDPSFSPILSPQLGALYGRCAA